MELLGPAPHDSSLQSRQNQGFARGEFTIDWDTKSANRPGGQRSFKWWEQKHHRNGTPVIKVFFSAGHCGPLPEADTVHQAPERPPGQRADLPAA